MKALESIKPRHNPPPRVPRAFTAAVVFLVLAGAGLPAATAQNPPGSAVAEQQQDVRQALSIAEAQHEIARLLIKQGRYERVPGEIKKILELNLPDKYEGNIAQSVSLIADMLVESKQYGVSHEILNEAFQRVKSRENKAALLKIQAFVFKTEGKFGEAIQALERAVDLERQKERP
jgi:tetratricopeptide (TPR) repeat protein